MHIYTHTYIYTYIHAYMHTYIPVSYLPYIHSWRCTYPYECSIFDSLIYIFMYPEVVISSVRY